MRDRVFLRVEGRKRRDAADRQLRAGPAEEFVDELACVHDRSPSVRSAVSRL